MTVRSPDAAPAGPAPRLARPVRFAITGAIAMVASLVGFTLARQAGAAGLTPTVVRLAVSVPILYLGYSRWVLVDLLAHDRVQAGPATAELRMILRVSAAVVVSSLAKLLIEPWLVAALTRHGAGAWVALTPLAGDLVYGPLLGYLVLTAATSPSTAGWPCRRRSRSAVERRSIRSSP